MIARISLSFLICFKISFSYALSENVVLKKYKESSKTMKYDPYRHIQETSENYFSDWPNFENYMNFQEDRQKKEGIAYILSGIAITIAAGVGYSSADSSTEKIAYSLAQSLSIGAIGYGTYTYYIGNNDRSFYHVLNRTEGLSMDNRNLLVLQYNKEKKWQKRQMNWIALGTYSLIALVNYINASREEDKGTRDSLFIIGGVYNLAAISIAF